MKYALILFLFIFAVACQSKTEVAANNANPERQQQQQRQQRAAQSQARMEAAILEMDGGGSASAPSGRPAAGMCADGVGSGADCQDPKQEPVAERPLENRPSPRGTVSEGRPSPTRAAKFPMRDGLPVWVSNPSHDGFLGGVGIAKPQSGGQPAQRRLAISLAQADLARTINILVDSEAVTERIMVDTRTQDFYREKLETMSRQNADEYLNNPQVMDEWINPTTGELYIWVVLPK